MPPQAHALTAGVYAKRHALKLSRDQTNEKIFNGVKVRITRQHLARPLNLATMSELRSGVYSQTLEVLHLLGVF